ncbi:hypothetical protein [Sphingomonas sp. M1-B02]|uniref:hypothetical protein n=1 Tax=Sphingomonas sp. M1-B02 TaxID=3114300 RepID=UPI002240499F|nr:hypothetical protein [Sphingomonas sp. S6-11]UZK66671.1 hypothetical protein OKW87_02195 [Sphingomonas sp. S6-11]
MYLVEDKAKRADVRTSEQLAGEGFMLATPIASPGGKWEHFPNSHISHHGKACCDIAHEWLIAYDFAQLNGGDILSGPRWMREHSAWGPSAWPIHWCEAVDAKIVDCGVHAAIAQEAFVARGLRAFRAQFIQRYSADAAASWRESWGKGDVSDHWIDGDAIYHEGNAVVVGDDHVKLWDGSAGWWINPRGEAGYGSLAAVRIDARVDSFATGLLWGNRRIPLNLWVEI